MTLAHHGPRPYNEAAAEAAEKTRFKLKSIIDKGRIRAQGTVESILNEYNKREDVLVPASAIGYNVGPGVPTALDIQVLLGNKQVNLTNHSVTQLLNRIGMPKTFAEKLSLGKTGWTRELLLHNLRTLTDGTLEENRLLFRIVDQTAKGVLSSAYRRMDASPIVSNFIKEGMGAGLVPVDGLNTDTRYHIKMLSTKIYEPVPNEVVTFGMSFTTSDYGAGALQLQFFLMRLVCTNYAIGEDCLRKVHLGKRFTEEEGRGFSQKTYDLDTETIASAVKDVISEGLEEKADTVCGLIANANEKKVSLQSELDKFRKKGLLTKDQSETAKALYENVTEITYLPEQKSAWRLSNVLSLMAQQQSGDKKLDLESAAMELLVA
jgi:hypothetical protein